MEKLNKYVTHASLFQLVDYNFDGTRDKHTETYSMIL